MVKRARVEKRIRNRKIRAAHGEQVQVQSQKYINFKTINQMRKDNELEPIDDADVIITNYHKESA